MAPKFVSFSLTRWKYNRTCLQIDHGKISLTDALVDFSDVDFELKNN